VVEGEVVTDTDTPRCAARWIYRHYPPGLATCFLEVGHLGHHSSGMFNWTDDTPDAMASPWRKVVVTDDDG